MSSYKNQKTFQKEYTGSLPQGGVPEGSKSFIAGEVFIWDGEDWGYIETQNNPPTFDNNIPSQIFLDSETGTDTIISFAATDPEFTNLIYTLETPPSTDSTVAEYNFNELTGILTVTPHIDELLAGSTDVVVEVTDGINTIRRTVNLVLQFAPPEADPSGVLFTTIGEHTWTVPDGVFSINAVVIGGGGGGGGNQGISGPGSSGGGGGALAWGNGLSVEAGDQFTVRVGNYGRAGTTSINGTAGQSSYITRSGDNAGLTANGGGGGASNVGTGVAGGVSGGAAASLGWVTYGLYIGGDGGRGITNGQASAGGGCAGYLGNGGNGYGASSSNQAPEADTGAAAGGYSINSTRPRDINAGGGVGPYGLTTTGVYSADPLLRQGSGGTPNSINGGLYGGGGGTPDDDTSSFGADGGQGVVRIIWGNTENPRAFPSTNVSEIYSIIPEITI